MYNKIYIYDHDFIKIVAFENELYAILRDDSFYVSRGHTFIELPLNTDNYDYSDIWVFEKYLVLLTNYTSHYSSEFILIIDKITSTNLYSFTM